MIFYTWKIIISYRLFLASALRGVSTNIPFLTFDAPVSNLDSLLLSNSLEVGKRSKFIAAGSCWDWVHQLLMLSRVPYSANCNPCNWPHFFQTYPCQVEGTFQRVFCKCSSKCYAILAVASSTNKAIEIFLKIVHLLYGTVQCGNIFCFQNFNTDKRGFQNNNCTLEELPILACVGIWTPS